MSENNKTTEKTLPLWGKIVIPIVIVGIIVGIYFLKNAPQTFVEEEVNNAEEGSEVSSNPDFDLHVVETLDLEQLKSYGVPIMIDFGADSCIPCKEMAPVLEKLNEELNDKAIIKFVDVWKYQELGAGFPIKLIPTQVFIDKDGNPFTPSESFSIPMMMYGNQETQEHIFTTHEGGLTEDMILEILIEMGME